MAIRHALLTGGSGALGTAVGRRLIGDGIQVTSAGRRRPGFGMLRHIQVDLTDDNAVDDIVAAADPAPDMLICLAAAPSAGALPDLSLDQLHGLMTVKVWTPARLAYAFAPAMAERGWGRIVLTGGITSRVPLPGYAAGAASNAAAAALVTALAREWIDTGVTVNCITPGGMETPRFRDTKQALAAGPDFTDGSPALSVDAVAAVIAFLVGPDSAALCGTDVLADGGAIARRPL